MQGIMHGIFQDFRKRDTTATSVFSLDDERENETVKLKTGIRFFTGTAKSVSATMYKRP